MIGIVGILICLIARHVPKSLADLVLAMPETIGLLILSQLGGDFAIFSIGAATITAAQVIGTAVLLAISIGLQYALAPKVQSQSATQQASRQNIPPRVVVLGRARAGTVYMLYETADNGDSVDVLAVCQGPIAGFVRYFLSDTEVKIGTYNGDDNVVVSTPEYSDGRYIGKVTIDTRLGLATETAYGEAVSRVPAVWTNDHRGDGIASMMVISNGVKQNDFLKYYPQGDPSPSAVVDGALMWDPRDPAQDPNDPATWVNYPVFAFGTDYAAGDRVLFRGSVFIARQNLNTGTAPDELPLDLPPALWASVWRNPVIGQINYLVNNDWGMALDRAMLIDPVKADLCAEADLCDRLQTRKSGASESLYTFGGSFTYETNPSEVIGNLQASCDGWMALNGEGGMVMLAGQYRPPTVTIKARHIFGMSVAFGQAQVDRPNELQIKFTSPSHKYKQVAGQAWRDEEDISERGKVNSQTLDLPWVQDHGQGRMLAKRAMARRNAPISVSFTTTLYGLVAQGKRWIRLQYPFLPDLADVVIEVQDSSEFDVFAGKCTIIGKVVNPNTIDAWDPETEEGEAPPDIDGTTGSELPVPDDVVAVAAGSPQFHIDVSWTDVGRDDLQYAIQYRLPDTGSGAGPWSTISINNPIGVDGRITGTIYPTTNADYEIQVASVGAQGTFSDWSDSVVVTTSAAALLDADGGVILDNSGASILENA